MTLHDYLGVVNDKTSGAAKSGGSGQTTQQAMEQAARSAIAQELAYSMSGGAALFQDSGTKSKILEKIGLFQKTYSGSAATEEATAKLAKVGTKASEDAAKAAAAVLLKEIAEMLWADMARVFEAKKKPLVVAGQNAVVSPLVKTTPAQ